MKQCQNILHKKHLYSDTDSVYRFKNTTSVFYVPLNLDVLIFSEMNWHQSSKPERLW